MKKLSTLEKVIYSILLFWTLFWLFFASVSGSEGKFINGLMNSLPEIVILAVVVLSIKFRKTGSVLLFLLGIGTVIYFNTYNNPVTFFLLSLPLLFSGISLYILAYKHLS